MNRYACWMRSLAAAAVLVFAVIAAPAQDVTGSISGTVTDPSGAAVKGATVDLINTDRNETVRTLTTNGAGFYTATSLPLGTYTVKVTDAGFKVDTVTGLILHVDDKLTVNRNLVVGSTNQSVTVAADALSVNLEDASSSGLITGTQSRELVLSTRNYEQLLSLQPGVAYSGTTDQIYLGPSNPVGGAANTVAFSVNGQRTSANNWTIDGADNVDRGSNLTLLTFPSIDAIAEFKTLRGQYSAEYGRSAAGQVNVVTRSGTNVFHGSAYEFFRNDALNANSWADKNFASPTSFLKRPPLRYNDFGYTIGGPVWLPKIYNGHDKTFFFFSQEFRRVINYNPIAISVPTADERKGIFPVAVCTNFVGNAASCADGGTTNVTTTSTAAQAYLKDVYSLDGSKVPLPNPGPTQEAHTYNYNPRSIYNDTQEVVRIDQAFGQKVNAFYRFIHDSIPTQEPFGYGSGTGAGYPGVQTTNTRSPGTQQLGHVTYVQSPKLLMDVGYAYSYGAILSASAGSGLSKNSPDINIPLPYPSYLGVIPNLVFTNYTGITQGGVYNDYDRNHNIFGNVTRLFGNHTVIVGATYDRYEKTENLQGGNVGSFSFTSSNAQLPVASQGNAEAIFYQSWANFLTGTVTGGFTQTGQPRIPDLHANTIEFYAQDNWKATSRFTINLGVRYSYFAQPTDSNGWLANFSPNAYVLANAPTVDNTGSLCIPNSPCHAGYTPNSAYDPSNGFIYANEGTYGVSGHSSPYGGQVGTSDKANVAPRFGFAYDVFGDGKTAIRGGYGIAYDATLFGDYEYNSWYAPPALGNSSYNYTSFDNPKLGTAKAAAIPAPPTPIYATGVQFHTPYSQQYSLDAQQQLTPSLLFDLGYYGAHDTHLVGYTDINALAPGQAKAAGILPAGGFASAAQTALSNQIRRYKGYAGMYAVEPIYNSNYNSLQLSVKKRFRGKSEITGAYTWQRNLSNGPIGDRSSAPQNVYNIKAEYGRAAYDRNQFASIDFVWDLPWFHEQKGLVARVVGGWEISGIVALDSGLPVTVTASQGGIAYGTTTTFTDVAGLAINGSSPASFRPDLISNPQSGSGLKTKTKWFNTSAFAVPSAVLGNPGDEKRGSVTQPGYDREDLGLFRNFRIFKESVFQLRGEAFNVLNHTNYNTANTTFTSTTFGTVTGAREARILQIAGKLTF